MAPVHGENGTYVSVFCFVLFGGQLLYLHLLPPHTNNKQTKREERKTRFNGSLRTEWMVV